MQPLLPLILFALVAAVLSPSATAAEEMDRSKAGAGASSEGGASLGGTGIDSGVANPRGVDERDRRLKLERKLPADKGGASSGSSTGATKARGDLSEEADKQDEEFRRKQDAERHK
jgi:hypothetical protein